MRSHQHRHAHLNQRVAEPQLGTRSINHNPVTSSVEVQNLAPSPTSRGNSVILGDPVFATPGSSPSPTQQSSNNNNNNNNSNNNGNENSSPSPTQQQQSPNVATTQQQSFPATTFATVTSDPNSDAYSTSSSNPYGGSSTTSNSGSSSSDTAVSGSSSSSGMSAGAKIGLAVGIVGVIGVFAVFLMLFMAKKRKAREAKERAQDEKRAAEQVAAANAAAAAKQKAAAPNAPRLSLRPVSRLVPDLMGGNRSKNRLSQDNMLTTFSESRGDRSHSPGANMYSSRPKENPFNDPINPFNDPEKAAAAGAAYHQPHGYAHELEDTRTMGSASRPGTSHSQFTGAPSPAVATGPGPDQPQGNVFRIMMDFKPTMEDELELRAGQHVRMLHEYDDGWALCIRLDRSQQGVVPRTCLAAKPSKPRPAPGPNGPNGYRGPQSRPTTPGTQGGPRMNSPSNQNFRPDSPANRGPDYRPQTSGSVASRHDPSIPQGTFNQAPRPLSPGPRPQPTQPLYAEPPRQRSNSTNDPNARGPRNSPPAPSNLGYGGPPSSEHAF